MTVSIKRWIAVLTLIAISLAGTPTIVKANDGLKSERYGFGNSIESKKEVIQWASLQHNPLRKNSVSASLSGSQIAIDESSIPETNIAVIIQTGTNDRSTIAQSPDLRHEVYWEPSASIRPPIFMNKPVSLHAKLLNVFDNLKQQSQEIWDLTVSNLNLETMDANMVPAKNVSAKLSAARLGHGSAVIRNISSGPIKPFIEARPISRPVRPGNVVIEVFEIEAKPSKKIDKDANRRLLIEQYSTDGLLSTKHKPAGPTRLNIPVCIMPVAMSTDFADTNDSSVFLSVKKGAKSLLNVASSVMGIQTGMICAKHSRLQNLLDVKAESLQSLFGFQAHLYPAGPHVDFH